MTTSDSTIWLVLGMVIGALVSSIVTVMLLRSGILG